MAAPGQGAPGQMTWLKGFHPGCHFFLLKEIYVYKREHIRGTTQFLSICRQRKCEINHKSQSMSILQRLHREGAIFWFTILKWKKSGRISWSCYWKSSVLFLRHSVVDRVVAELQRFRKNTIRGYLRLSAKRTTWPIHVCCYKDRLVVNIMRRLHNGPARTSARSC